MIIYWIIGYALGIAAYFILFTKYIQNEKKYSVEIRKLERKYDLLLAHINETKDIIDNMNSSMGTLPKVKSKDKVKAKTRTTFDRSYYQYFCIMCGTYTNQIPKHKTPNEIIDCPSCHFQKSAIVLEQNLYNYDHAKKSYRAKRWPIEVRKKFKDMETALASPTFKTLSDQLKTVADKLELENASKKR